jgi:thiol-disulfide isomerase/thioredoxin
MKVLVLGLLAAFVCPAQSPPTSAPLIEDQELSRALAEAGSSPVDFVRALETHLVKYPATAKRAEIERALVKAAIEGKDDKRIVLYGERVLAREPGDPQILDRVTRALLASDAKDTSERALQYARREEEQVASLRKQPAPGHAGEGQWQEELDRGVARALAMEARATGNLGKMNEALALARKSYDEFPTAEGAREIARWLARTGKEEEAIGPLADAFTIADARNSDKDRAEDRARIGELYRKLKGSEKGLGDLVLEAYDRTHALLAARNLRLRENDPNAQASKVLEFTLSGLKGDMLKLAFLKGKTVVFDFWATWCGPCRAQHPLYEEVKRKFAANPNVIFVSVNTDENRDLVAPFLRDQKWNNDVYFEDGLTRALRITSIPTTIIVDKHGEVASRMNGFLPDRFVEMLADRIQQALKN